MKTLNGETRRQLQLLFGKKSNTKGMLAILKNWMAFLLGISLVYLALQSNSNIAIVGIYIPVSFIIGCVLRGFDNLTHEASHNNIFTEVSKHLKLQFLFAFPVAKTVEDYRPGHWKHHRNYRDNKADDPDTAQNIRWGVEFLSENKTLRQIVWLYITRLLLLYYVIDNIRYNLIPHIKSKKAVSARLIFWTSIFLVMTVTNAWTLFFFAYIIPYFFWLPYIRFVTESSKHTNVNLEDDFANSRNNIGWLHQHILHPHNDGFHQMHHYMASIPFYNLKKAYKFIKLEPFVRSRVIESRNPIQTIKQIFEIK